MFKRLIKLIILVPVAVVLIALSVANRQSVQLSIDPFNEVNPSAAIDVPLFAALFAALVIGVVLGGMGAWLRKGKAVRISQSRVEADKNQQQQDKSAKVEAEEILTGASTGTLLPAPNDARAA